MPRAVLQCLLLLSARPVEGSDTTSLLQLRTAANRSERKMVLLPNKLYWQGYGSGETLWSYFIGFLGEDQVHLGGLHTLAKVGINLLGNVPLGNMYQSVSTDASILGLLPGCFSSCDASDHDDLLSTLAKGGQIKRAFTMCLSERGGRLYLGKPQESLLSATRIPLVSPVAGAGYAPLSTYTGNAKVRFFFGHHEVGSQTAAEWNTLMKQGYGYTDTGTPGLLLPSPVLAKILETLREGIMGDQLCQPLWGHHLTKLAPGYVDDLVVAGTAVRCASKHLSDFEVRLGPNLSLSVYKGSFFYETEPCSGQFRISWSSGGDGVVFGTAFNWGQSILYDTSDPASPQLVLLGPAGSCDVNYGEEGTKAIETKGVPGQVLGKRGAIVADLKVGTPPQTVTVQLDTGSPKLLAVHQSCRDLGNCFLVQPVDGENTALLPGADYDTPTCREQVDTLAKQLTQQSCSRLESKLLCECSSQEECLARIMRTASEHLVPSNICAIQRKMCGETVDFHPEFSQTFSPARFAISPFLNSPGKQEVQAMCFLHRACHAVDDPAKSNLEPEMHRFRKRSPRARVKSHIFARELLKRRRAFARTSRLSRPHK